MKKILITCFTMLFLASCGSNNSDVINPEAELLYFYGATCPHCQDLNRKIKESGGIEQFSVEKREVYYNPENNKIFLDTAKELKIEEGKVWVPFVYNKTTWKYAIGTEPAFEIFMDSIKSSTGGVLEKSSTSSLIVE